MLQQKDIVDNSGASDNAIRTMEGLELSPNSPRTHLSASSDKKSCSTSHEERTFDYCMTSCSIDPTTDAPLLEEQAPSVDNNLYHYQLNNDSSQPENDGVDFFGNGLDNKECNRLLYYGWNEIENFEDVDRMFRNCDSTFGFDIDTNVVELGWFSPSHATVGSNDAIKPSFNFAGCDTPGLDGVPEQQEVYELNSSGLVADEKLAPVDSKRGSQKSTANDPSAFMDACVENGSRVVSGIDSVSQIHSHQSLVNQSEQQKPSQGKRKERPSEDGFSSIHFDSLDQIAESSHSINCQSSLSSKNHQQKEEQMPSSLVNLNNSLSSDQGLQSSPSSIVKCEDSGLPSISPRESSYASSHMQSVEISRDDSLQNPSIPRNKKKGRAIQHRLSVHSEKGTLMVQIADPDPVCAQKLFENENEGQSEFDKEVGIAIELDSSNMQESSCMTSFLDEVSIDASSFQQLQNVMEKLDVKTKLCIRDSLYRLARSAERRHKCVNPASGDKDDKDTNGTLLSDGTNKCSGFMDMETGTNPIDRSIAHLLFHRPSDSLQQLL